MNQQFVTTHRVRSYELDSFGHVNNAVFLNYLEYARAEYLLQKGLSFNDFLKWNALPYVTHVEMAFKASARVHDVLEIHGEISEWRRIQFTMHYRMMNTTAQRLCLVADVRFAFVNRNEKPVAIPNEFRLAME
jgi:YbgC/YbaW family acyl-CoA thioester hydrolase